MDSHVEQWAERMGRSLGQAILDLNNLWKRTPGHLDLATQTDTEEFFNKVADSLSIKIFNEDSETKMEYRATLLQITAGVCAKVFEYICDEATQELVNGRNSLVN